MHMPACGCPFTVHGDLKPGNVLLKTHKVDRRGYIAKVRNTCAGSTCCCEIELES